MARQHLEINSTDLKELARPYFFKSASAPAKALVILIHGFGASATETRPLGSFLQKNGYDIYGILLSGHGKDSRELDRIKWDQWYKGIEDAYYKYNDQYSKIFIGGVSLGGALSLYASTRLKITGVFTINAICGFSFLDRIFINILKIFKYHKPRSEERIKWYREHNLFAYHDDSILGAYQILKLLKELYKKVEYINSPVLLIQSQTDRTIDPRCGDKLFSKLKTQDKELFKLPEGDHILTVDPNRIIAFEKILTFLNSHLLNRNLFSKSLGD